ncbi:hypothetical protein RUND412_002955 [Rhizina undulata]
MVSTKTVLFLSGLLAQGVLGNIVFPKPIIDCSAGVDKCLRGQYCDENKFCQCRSTLELTRRSPIPAPAAGDYSTNGQCGPANGGLICDPNSTVYTGTCCSQYGWCGNTPAHCGDGCLSGCTVTGTTTTATPVTTAAVESSTASGTAARSDGRCGTAYGGATCTGSAFGGCCSEYGYCGTTVDHCLVANGCQSGCTDAAASGTSTSPATTTSGEPVLSSPSATSSSTGGGATTDGTCGSTNGGTTCVGWPLGQCCSMYGFCGNTTSHCGDGCQSGPCTGGAEVAAPGPSPAPITGGGSFAVIGQSGVPAMHAGLLPNGRVVFLDKVENYTQLKLSDGQYAYSSEYDPETNTVVPLSYKTNAFCAGGVFLANGDFVSLGGNAPLSWLDPTVGDGFNAIRYLKRSSSDASLNGQDWSEPGNKLVSDRWYASAHTLADGRVFVASGSLNGLDPTVPANNNPTYELLSPAGISSGVNYTLDILVKNQPYYMYPFMYLLNDGQMFIFTAKESQIFNIDTNTVTKSMPDLPGDYRTYPNTGGAVLLPMSSADSWAPKIMICGGGAYQDITSPTEPSCGVISPQAANASWEMDSMPEGRGMVEAVLLPDGNVLWLNGCNRGSQGFELATDPTYAALLYNPTLALGKRWTQLASTTIPRLYHSVALLLLDGTIMVAGSNPHEMPILTPPSATLPYITEFRVERFTPPYLQGNNANLRPTNVVIPTKSLPADGSLFTFTFDVPTTAQDLKIVLYHGGFVTHSVHMGHRMMFLERRNWKIGQVSQTITARMPPNKNVAPPGPWVLYVLVDGIPSVGQFIMVV